MAKFALTLPLLAFLVYSALAATPCKQRKFNHDSFVCVCDADHCDTIDPLKVTDRGVVQIFESTRQGKRFEYREQRFGDGYTPPGGYQWDVTVDRSGSFQEIIGFGGAFSDAASLSIGSLPEKQQNDLLSSYYGTNGIEYSIGRVVISGSDFSNRPYTYNDKEWDWELSTFAFVDEDINYKIPQILKAQQLSSLKIKYFASSWSPPAWLKSNGELNHGGTLNEGAGSIYWKTYAKYLLKFFEGYKAKGIDWWGMTVQNEAAIFDPWFPWNTCGFSAEMERDFVKTDLGPELEAAGYTKDKFKIMVLDHNRNLLPGWSDVILNDPEAARLIAGTGVHWYGNDVSSATTYDYLHNNHPDHFILATEACAAGPDGDSPALGSWDIGEQYAHDIIRDLTHWVTGWTDWNLALDMLGGPNWVQNYQSAPIHVDAAAREFYKNPSFYAMGHHSKFLPPNSKRIRSNPEIVDNDKFQTGVFQRPDGGIVFIAINSWDDNQALTINDAERGQIKINIEPRSFNTFLYY